MFAAFANLRLAHRLAVAFGALGAALALVAFIATSGLTELQDKTHDLGARDLPAVELAGGLNQRAQTIARVTAQHLYVHDGDLETQDEVQERALGLEEKNAETVERLGDLLAGTPAEEPLDALAAT